MPIKAGCDHHRCTADGFCRLSGRTTSLPQIAHPGLERRAGRNAGLLCGRLLCLACSWAWAYTPPFPEITCRALLLCLLATCRGVDVFVEQPAASLVAFPYMKWMHRTISTYVMAKPILVRLEDLHQTGMEYMLGADGDAWLLRWRSGERAQSTKEVPKERTDEAAFPKTNGLSNHFLVPQRVFKQTQTINDLFAWFRK